MIRFCARALFLLVLASTVAPSAPADELADQLKPLIEGHKGKVCIAIENLKTGEKYAHNADEPMPTASLIKLPLMVTAYQAAADKKVDLDSFVTLEADDQVAGSGILTTQFSPGARFSLRDAIRLMIAYSDNSATNLVAEQVSLEATGKHMESLGLKETKLNSYVFKRDTSINPERSKKYGLGSTTAGEMIRLLTMLHEKKLVTPEACDEMLGHLRACEDRGKLPRFLPTGTKIAHKTGSVNEVRCDAGIIDSPSGPIAVCVLTAENADKSWGNENAAEILCGRVAQIAFKHFQTGEDIETAKNAKTTLAIGSNGLLVEALQRTLNARLDPSPELGVDGDFGPATRSAVVRFQEAHKLKATGEVGPEMWKALGPIVTEAAPVPVPDVVNAEELKREPPLSLDGPPFVTCKGWAIGDGKTGKLLWGHNADQKLHPASTTKIMTAYLVALLAERDPSVLDEKITFSKRADDTIGSTSDIHAGEIVTVGELLYGLMLPSGNDASVAFGEHFGDRLVAEIPGAERKRDSLDNFITAMNHKAKELGLKETSYENTHGLTSDTHKTSPRDLLTLAWNAKKVPLFDRCTNTRQRGYQLASAAGYTRNILWKNTNELLKIEGFDGVKTGTTDAAGACLVSRGNRDDKQLIVVVLGSVTSDARYTDSRNLYRWAWQQLEKMSVSTERPPVVLTDEAKKLHESALVIDGHNDMPWEIREQGSASFIKLDISQPQPKLHTDIPRLRKGGVGAQFWSVWVPAYTAYDGTALATTLEQIEIVKAMIARYPDAFELALTPADVRRIHAEGRIASMIGVEGGHCIENSLGSLRKLFELGARYMTLTHSDSLDWADSGTDKSKANGLNEFGKEVVREMNRMGMLVDISHVSEKTMQDVLDATKAPVIFSHSSARAVADHPRNVPDAILKQMPKNGGVVMVNYYSGFVVPEGAARGRLQLEYDDELKQKGISGPERRKLVTAWKLKNPAPAGTIHDVLDHIDHITKVAGVDHVGLGSDFDGVTLLPTQLEDVSTYPYITQGLLDRGYSADDIRKILGGNLMRVWDQAEKVSKQLQAEQGEAK